MSFIQLVITLYIFHYNFIIMKYRDKNPLLFPKVPFMPFLTNEML